MVVVVVVLLLVVVGLQAGFVPENEASSSVGWPLLRLASMTTVHEWSTVDDHENVLSKSLPKVKRLGCPVDRDDDLVVGRVTVVGTE